MSLRQREPRKKDAAHLAFVRSQPCCVCGTSRNIEAAHIRMPCPARGKEPTGMQQKPDDKWTVPLCAYHHRTGTLAQHKIGEQEFWTLRGIDPFAIALDLWAKSGGADREAAPARKSSPRQPKAKQKPRVRMTIPGRRFDGTPIPSRRISASEADHA